jgi:hypothetical protein
MSQENDEAQTLKTNPHFLEELFGISPQQGLRTPPGPRIDKTRAFSLGYKTKFPTDKQ